MRKKEAGQRKGQEDCRLSHQDAGEGNKRDQHMRTRRKRCSGEASAKTVSVGCVKTEHFVARTFFCGVSVAHLLVSHARACVWLKISQELCCPLAALNKSSTHSMFHRPLAFPDPFPSFCSPPPLSTSTARHMTEIRRPPCATPQGGLLFGHLAESTPQVVSPRLASTSAVSTRRSPQQASPSVVNPWLGADMWSDRDLEIVQTLSERRNLHVYLEQ